MQLNMFLPIDLLKHLFIDLSIEKYIHSKSWKNKILGGLNTALKHIEAA